MGLRTVEEINDDNCGSFNGENLIVLNGVTINEKLPNGKLPFNLVFVYGVIELTHCGLSSLEGFPMFTDGSVYLYDNNLESLNGIPMYVGGRLTASNNPLKVIGSNSIYCDDFVLKNTNIENLEGCPRNIGDLLMLHENFKLTSLKGIPNCIFGSVSLDWWNIDPKDNYYPSYCYSATTNSYVTSKMDKLKQYCEISIDKKSYNHSNSPNDSNYELNFNRKEKIRKLNRAKCIMDVCKKYNIDASSLLKEK